VWKEGNRKSKGVEKKGWAEKGGKPKIFGEFLPVRGGG